MNLFVFSSNRALNDFYMQNENILLPDAKNIKTFFDEIIITKGKIKIPESIRNVILWNLIQNIEIEKIGFNKAFLRFLENSSFIFNFFDELNTSMVNIKDIDINDTYGDYSDHLNILNKIYDVYAQKLQEMNLYDKLGEFKIHSSYLKYYKNIYIFIDGILSKRDLHILKLCTSWTNIEIIFEYNKYNAFIFNGILNPSKNLLKYDTKYTYNLNKNKIIDSSPIALNNPKIELYSFSIRMNQALLVIAKVNEWLKDGFNNIAVIVNDNSFIQYLHCFDKGKNLNYAMGLEDSTNIKKINDLKLNIIEIHNNENSKLMNILNAISKINKNIYDSFLELQLIENLFQNLEYSEIIDFLLTKIPNIDDVNGGKVRVMGILETRGIKFDKVIIVDFNEEFIPKKNNNDMFLNTAIRKKISLPTMLDKENLQRHYYYNLIKNSNEIHISFCLNNLPSNLIDDLALIYNIDIENVINGENLWSFFPPKQDKNYLEENINAKNTNYNLSATSIDTFNNCKRKYYFSYIEKLRIDDNDLYYGSIIHNYLKDLNNNFNAKALEELIMKDKNLDSIKRLDLKIISKKLNPFLKTQNELLKTKREILNRELKFDIEISGFNFNGRIDRIDRIESQIFVIDYKLKNKFNIKKMSFIQLLIYKKAIEKEYPNYKINTLYYDLYNNKVYIMNEDDEKISQEILDNILDELQKTNIDFIKTNDLKICTNCNYKHLCNRF